MSRSGNRDLADAIRHHRDGNTGRAVKLYRRVIGKSAGHFLAYHHLSIIEAEAANFASAESLNQGALELRPNDPDVWLVRGNVLAELLRYEEAVTAFTRALAFNPNLLNALLGLGLVCDKLNRIEEALLAYDSAIALNPALAGTWLGRAGVCKAAGRADEALSAYHRALALDPRLAEARFGRGHLLYSVRKYEQAIADFEAALALQPRFPELRGICLDAKLHLCDWSEFDRHSAELCAPAGENDLPSPPYCLLSVPSSGATQLQQTRRWAARNFAPHHGAERHEAGAASDRIHLAYLSADFREHPVAALAVALFEAHDRSRFRVTGISIGPNDRSDMRRRVEAAFDEFEDWQNLGDDEIAARIRVRNIDILVDLTGYTGGARTGILARRPAPLQVSYLGYPATMGVEYVDYVIGDATVLPPACWPHYAEKVVSLPDSFLAVDGAARVSDRVFTRAELGLPPAGFVFCCFNNAFKITPRIFDAWMRILAAVPDSILWLRIDNPTAIANLKTGARARGIDEDRLIFAGRMADVSDHVARHACADLFLDTLPYNAHATAVDALRADLPILTCLGETFAGRVGASLLNALGMPELIARSLEEYETRAVEIASDPDKARDLRLRLSGKRREEALFDTARFARNIESAYVAMHERFRCGLGPDHFSVDAQPACAASQPKFLCHGRQ
ncbi:MAG: tetratricopeptide repeat protein [Bradyrhizobium sp.]|nr:tetratricopeptide repeat protein [Bradyrhizobium sp.]